MSYYTNAEFFYLGDEQFNLTELQASLPSIVEDCMVSTDVVSDVVELISDGKASLKIYAEHVIGIFSCIAKTDADVAFVIRGSGEAPNDVWLREFREGAPTLTLGPPPNYL